MDRSNLKYFAAVTAVLLTAGFLSGTPTLEGTVASISTGNFSLPQTQALQDQTSPETTETSTVNLQKGLKAYYRFDNPEVSRGYSLEFDGEDDGVLVSDSESLDIEENITASAWVKPDDCADSHGTVVMKQGAYYLQVHDDCNVAIFTYYNNSGSASGTYLYSGESVERDRWSHIAFTKFANGTETIFIDGNPVNSQFGGEGIWTSDNPLSIGNQNIGDGDRRFDGSIDEVRLYNRSMTQSEIERLSENRIVSDKGLVLHQEFNEDPRSCVLTSEVACLKGKSQSDNHGTPRNFDDNLFGTGSGWVNSTPLNRLSIVDSGRDPEIRGRFYGVNNAQLVNFDYNSTNGWVKGYQSSHAVGFSGGDEYVDIENSGKVGESISTAPFAIEFWIKPISTTATYWSEYMRFESTSSRIEIKDPEYSWGGIDTMAVFWYNQSGGQIFDGSTSSLNPKSWNHVLFQYDRNNFEFYVNGNLQASTSVSEPAADIGDSVVLDGPDINWSVDKLRFYNRTFSDSEVQEKYQNSDNFEQDLTGQWDFDSGDRSIAYNTAGIKEKEGLLGTKGSFLGSGFIEIKNLDLKSDFTVSIWAKSAEAMNPVFSLGEQSVDWYTVKNDFNVDSDMKFAIPDESKIFGQAERLRGIGNLQFGPMELVELSQNNSRFYYIGKGSYGDTLRIYNHKGYPNDRSNWKRIYSGQQIQSSNLVVTNGLYKAVWNEDGTFDIHFWNESSQKYDDQVDNYGFTTDFDNSTHGTIEGNVQLDEVLKIEISNQKIIVVDEYQRGDEKVKYEHTFYLGRPFHRWEVEGEISPNGQAESVTIEWFNLDSNTDNSKLNDYSFWMFEDDSNSIFASTWNDSDISADTGGGNMRLGNLDSEDATWWGIVPEYVSGSSVDSNEYSKIKDWVNNSFNEFRLPSKTLYVTKNMLKYESEGETILFSNNFDNYRNIVLVKEGSTIAVSVGGERIGKTNITLSELENIRIGFDSLGVTGIDSVDELRVYNRTLSDREINRLAFK